MDTVPDLTPDALPDADALLAQLGQDDPRMAALCRFFVQRQAQVAQDAAATCEDALHADAAAVAQVEARLERLRGIARGMHAELRVLRERDAVLAAALGACAACWGEDPACAECAGHGRPGAALPDAPLYARVIAPAVRHLMQARRDERPRPSPDRAVDGDAVGRLD